MDILCIIWCSAVVCHLIFKTRNLPAVPVSHSLSRRYYLTVCVVADNDEVVWVNLSWLCFHNLLRWNLYSTDLKNCVDFTNFLGIVGISFQWLSLSIFIGSTIGIDVLSYCSFKQPSPPWWWWEVSECVRQTSLNITIGLWSSCRVKLIEYLYCSV